MEYLLGGALGGLIATMFAIPAIVLEWNQRVPVKDAPLLVDVRSIFGVKIKHPQEVFLIGLLMHEIIGFLFGLVYIVFVEQGWLFVTNAPYTLLSLFVYAVLSWVVANLVLYPALGMGWFAAKEGRHVWLETLVSHLLLGVSLWVLVKLFQPFYF